TSAPPAWWRGAIAISCGSRRISTTRNRRLIECSKCSLSKERRPLRTVEVTDELQDFLDGLVAPRDPVLARMEKEAHSENIPIVDTHEGALLTLLIRIAGSKRILELGTATGYSGLCMLRGTSNGSLTTYEMDHQRAERARANFSEAGYGKAAIVLEQDAVSGLENLDGRFDACFIDLLNSFPSEEVTRRV